MFIIKIPLTTGKESFYKKGFVGNLPRTMDRHEATQFKSEPYANTIAKNLGVKHLDREFKVEGY